MSASKTKQTPPVWPRGALLGPVLAAFLAGGASGTGMAVDRPSPEAGLAAVRKLVEDYVGLYAGPTLDRWKALFHPSLSVASPQADGGIRVRGLEEFFAAQQGYFATGRRISERLENVRIEEGRRIARVTADFVFADEGQERRGKLGLHLAEESDTWKVVAILFSYDQP